ncbi:MAG: UDP-N-acetylglucosamine 2-epimerase [Giesbergeria sp.]
MDAVLADVAPEALLVLGDTNSCMAVLPAKRRKVPVFHMEAGNRCFDQRVPEEINRRIVDHTADINLTYSTHRPRLPAARGPAARPWSSKPAAPWPKCWRITARALMPLDVLGRLGLAEGQFFVVSAHREENIDSDLNFGKLVQVLNTVAEQYGLPVIVSTHPRTQKRVDATGRAVSCQRCSCSSRWAFTDYNQLAAVSAGGAVRQRHHQRRDRPSSTSRR